MRGVRTVHAPESVRTRCGDDRVHDGMPAMSGIELVIRIVDADTCRWHVHRRRIVSHAEDQRLESRRGRCDFADPQETSRGLDLCFDTYRAREPLPFLYLREQRCDEVYVRRLT